MFIVEKQKIQYYLVWEKCGKRESPLFNKTESGIRIQVEGGEDQLHRAVLLRAPCGNQVTVCIIVLSLFVADSFSCIMSLCSSVLFLCSCFMAVFLFAYSANRSFITYPASIPGNGTGKYIPVRVLLAAKNQNATNAVNRSDEKQQIREEKFSRWYKRLITKQDRARYASRQVVYETYPGAGLATKCEPFNRLCSFLL